MATEVTEICQRIGVADVCRERVTKAEVSEAITFHNLKALKDGMENSKKISELRNTDMRNRVS